MRRIAILSPFSPRIKPANNFKVSKSNRKYHSGMIFSGAGARGSAFFPISGGASVASVTTIPRTISQIIRSLYTKFGKKGVSFSYSFSTDTGTLMPWY